MLIDEDVGRGRVVGRCDSEFSSVGDAFIENFSSRDEVGASVCVNVGGETVVDLWGGRVAAAEDAPRRGPTKRSRSCFPARRPRPRCAHTC